jgi:hypothetical protein
MLYLGTGTSARSPINEKYSRAELPEPSDSRITIREIPGRSFAAVRYSGTWSKRNYEKHLGQLLDTLSAEDYAPVGDPIWTRYDPPFMPWFLRRNEILTEFRVMGTETSNVTKLPSPALL